MASFIPNEGEEAILDALTGVTPMGNLELRLYTDDHTDNEADTAASFTDATFATYAPVTLTPGSFVQAISANSTMTFPQQSYTTTDTPGQSVFGYYVVQVSTGKVVLAEKFSDGAKTVVSGGSPFLLDFVLQLPAEA